MKLTPDFKARQYQLRTVCRRFSPKKRNKIRQKNQKGRSLKRTVLKPSANLWFLIISYNDILLFIQSALSYFFYFFFFTFVFPSTSETEENLLTKTVFQGSILHLRLKIVPCSIFLNTCFGAENENFMKFLTSSLSNIPLFTLCVRG